MKSLCERSHIHLNNLSKVLDMTNDAYLQTTTTVGGTVLKKSVETLNGLIDMEDTLSDDQLVLYITESSCNPCVKRELQNVKRLSDEGYDIFMIGVFNTQREFLSLLTQYGLSSNYITISPSTKIFEEEKEPIANLEYFMVDNQRSVSKTFLPVQRNDTLSVEYLNKLNLKRRTK
jgi:soluble P-type ATPase